MKWNTVLFGILSCLAVGVAGCSQGGGTGASGEAKPKPGPHGGVAVPLAGGKAYAEVKVENAGGAKTNPQSRLVVFFLESDLKAALGSAPTAVTAKIVPPVGEERTLTLTAEATDKDPLSKQRFVSPPGKFDFDELKGDVSASIGGETATAAFAFH